MICDRQTDARGKTICLPTLKGGDLIPDKQNFDYFFFDQF